MKSLGKLCIAPILGGLKVKVPQNWEATAVLGSPQVEQVARI